MVGYILGLGDRHPSNIMLQRMTGRIVHIDFGDCWEIAMRREKFPEKVPFRLTRMLIKAMEASGIEGNYRNTCEIVMRVLRQERESLMAVLEAFIYDPLLNWRLLKTVSPNKNNEDVLEISQDNTSNSKLGGIILSQNKMEEKSLKDDIRQAINADEIDNPVELLNMKALAAVEIIRGKLIGKDFDNQESLDVVDQVNKLIQQASSHENVCQAYLGWCPFW